MNQKVIIGAAIVVMLVNVITYVAQMRENNLLSEQISALQANHMSQMEQMQGFNNNENVMNGLLMNEAEAASYLRLDEKDIKYLIAVQEQELKSRTTIHGNLFPYLTIRGKHYVVSAQLDRWLHDAALVSSHY